MHRNPNIDDVFDVMIDIVKHPGPVNLTRVWDFYVGVSTHDLLKEGITVHHYTYVQVAARTYAEAQDIAAAMAACGGWMPTKTIRI